MMAPNGHTASRQRSGRASLTKSRQDWLEQYGSDEYRIWQKENPSQPLSYEQWKQSNHVNGLSLYYATLHIFDEPDSSVSEMPRQGNLF